MSHRLLSLAALAAILASTNLHAQGDDLRKTIKAAWSQGKWSSVSDAASKLVALHPKDGVAWYQLGYALHAQKKYDRALKAHITAAKFQGNPRVQQPATYNAACVYSIQKKPDLAFQWLEKAAELGFGQVNTVQNDPDMDNIRKDPRFAKVLKRMAKNNSPQAMRVFTPSTKRQSQRVAYFGKQGSGGQLAIDYGAVKWQSKYDGILDKDELVGRRWRLGADFWTNLDTNVPLTLGGKKIAPGQYYLTLTHLGNRKFELTLLDPNEVRKYRMDGFVAHLTTGGIAVPMQHESTADAAKELAIKAKMSAEDNARGALTIHFGPHVLRTKMKVHVGQ